MHIGEQQSQNGARSLLDPLVGVLKLVNLDSESMQMIVTVCRRTPELPADLFTHPYFGTVTKLDLSNWKMKSLPPSELWFDHVLSGHCCGEGSAIVGLLHGLLPKLKGLGEMWA